jgi:hypothetical protein
MKTKFSVIMLLIMVPFAIKANDLFLATGTPFAMALDRNEYETRERFALLNTGVLGEPGTSFELNFFPDQSFSVIVTKVEQVGPATVYHCAATEALEAHILVSQVNSAFCITFSAPGKPGFQATYAEAYTGLPIHRVVEVDPTLVKHERAVGPVSADILQDSPGAETWEIFALREVETASITNYYIGIMVLYTMNVSYYYGSNAGAESAIANAVATLNQALVNTQINPPNTYSVNLVYTAMTSYNETTNDLLTDFYNLRDDTNGLEGARSLGNYHGADLISLWTDYPSSPTQLSRGSPLSKTTPSDTAKFSVINTRQANPAGMTVKAFTHEIGHNLGAMHDYRDVSLPGVVMWDDWAVGYALYLHDPNAPFGDWFGEQMVGTSSVEYILQFSNPNTFYKGYPVGRQINMTHPSNFAESLRTSFPFVSNYR